MADRPDPYGWRRPPPAPEEEQPPWTPPEWPTEPEIDPVAELATLLDDQQPPEQLPTAEEEPPPQVPAPVGLSPWQAAGFSDQGSWAAAGWPAPLDPDTGQPWEGWKMWRMEQGRHPSGRKMTDEDWFNPYTQHILEFVRIRRLYDNPLWAWAERMRATHPDYPMPGINVQELLRQTFPEWYEEEPTLGAPPLPTLPEGVRRQMEVLGITPPEAPTWPAEPPEAAPTEAEPTAWTFPELPPSVLGQMEFLFGEKPEVPSAITPAPFEQWREPWQEMAPPPSAEAERPLEELPTPIAPEAVPTEEPPIEPAVTPATQYPMPYGELPPGLTPGLTPEQIEEVRASLARRWPIQFAALREEDISAARRVGLAIQGVLSLPWNYYLKPLFDGMYELAKIPERLALVTSEVVGQGLPGADLYSSAVLQATGEAIDPEAVYYKRYVEEEKAERPVGRELIKDAWDLGYIGYSLLQRPAAREDAWRMLEEDKPLAEIIKKHEDVATEFIGNILIDPMWLVPAAWSEKALPIGKALKGASNSLKTKPGIGYLIDVTKAGRVKTYGYAISDTMDTYMTHMPEGESVGAWLGRMLMGDEEALATLGVYQRNRLVEAAATFKRHDSTWQAMITKYSPEVVAGMPPAKKAAAMAKIEESMQALAERIIRKTSPADLAEMEALLERDPRKIGRWLAEGLTNLKRRELGLKPIEARGALYRGMSFASQLWKETILPINIAFHQVNLLDSTVRMSLRGYFWDPGDLPVLNRILQKLTGRQPLEARVTAELEGLGLTLPRELQTGLIRELMDTEGYRLKTRYAMRKVPIPFIGKPNAILDGFKKLTGNDLVTWAAEASTKGGIRGRLGKLIGAVRFEDASIPIAQAQEMGKGYEYLAKALNRTNLASLVEAGAENLNIEPLVRITTFWKESEPLFNQARFGVADLIEGTLLESNPGREAIVEEIAEQVRNPNVVQSVADLGTLIDRYIADVGPKLDAFKLSFRHIQGNDTLLEVARETRRFARKPTTESALDDIFAYGRRAAEENHSKIVAQVSPEQATIEQLRLSGAPEHLPDEILQRKAQADAAIGRAYKRMGSAVKRIEDVRGSDLSFLDLGRTVSSKVNREVWQPHWDWYYNDFWPGFEAKLDYAKAVGDSLEVSRLWASFRETVPPKFDEVGLKAAQYVDDLTKEFLKDVPTDELLKALDVFPEERMAEAVGAIPDGLQPLVAEITQYKSAEEARNGLIETIGKYRNQGYWVGGEKGIQLDKGLQKIVRELDAGDFRGVIHELAEIKAFQERGIDPFDLSKSGYRGISEALEKNIDIHRLATKLEKNIPEKYGSLADLYSLAPTAEVLAPEVAEGLQPVAERLPDEAPGLVDRILEQEAERVAAEDASLLERAKALYDDTLEALTEMQEQALTKFRTSKEVAEEAPEALVGLEELKMPAMRQMADGYEGAVAQGIETVHELFYDYAARKGVDELLWWVSPFTIWQTRNPFGWAKAIARKPAIVNVIRRTMAFTEVEREERALPGRFEGTLPIPGAITKPLIDQGIIPDGYYAMDVRQFFSIWGQSPAIEGDLPWGWEDEPMIGKVIRTGEFVGIRTHPWWQIPLERMGAYGSVPASDLTYFSKYIRAITKAAGREVDIEKPLRDWRDRNEQNGIARYYGNLRLLDYFFEEEISMEDLVEAVGNPGNPLFNQAYQEAADWHAKLGLVRGLEPFTVKHASPAEQEARLLQREYFNLPVPQRAAFRDEHPLLVAYWAALRDPEEAEESRRWQRREQWSAAVRDISAAAMAKVGLGTKAYEEIVDRRRAMLDQVQDLFPYEPRRLLASGMQFEAQKYFDLTASFFDEGGGLKEEFEWEDYYAARDGFMNELVAEYGDPSPRLAFEQYLANNEQPADAIVRAWETLYGQTVWDVINEQRDNEDRTEANRLIAEAKKRADKGRTDTQGLLAEVLRLHPDWTAEQAYEAKQAAKKLQGWDVWSRRNQPLRDALESVIWSGYMGLDDLARKRFREFIREEAGANVADSFEKFMLDRDRRNINDVSSKVLLQIADYVGGLINLQREGFQQDIEETEKEYELEPIERPAEIPEGEAEEPEAGRPPGKAMPPPPPLIPPSVKPGGATPEQLETFKQWVFKQAGFTPEAMKELGPLVIMGLAEFMHWLAPARGEEVGKIEHVGPWVSPAGGGFAGPPGHIVFATTQLEAAIHEYAHNYWFPRKEEHGDALVEALMRLAEETGPQYKDAAELGRIYVHGDPKTGFAGMKMDEGQWNIDEIFAGIASFTMGHLDILPPYMREFYTGLFTGKPGKYAEKGEYYLPLAARIHRNITKAMREMKSFALPMTAQERQWQAEAYEQMAWEGLLSDSEQERQYAHEYLSQNVPEYRTMPEEQRLAKAQQIRAEMPSPPEARGEGLPEDELARMWGDYQNPEYPIARLVFAWAHGQAGSPQETRAEWEKIPQEQRYAALEWFFDQLWPNVQSHPERFGEEQKDWQRVKEFLDFIGITDVREQAKTGGRPPGKAMPMPMGEGMPPPAPPEEEPPPPPRYGERAFVPPPPAEEAEYDQARTEMEAWVAAGKEGDWTPLMEKWFGTPGGTPQGRFWEYYWGEIPPGRIAGDLRADPIIGMLLNKAFRTVYDVKEGVWEQALGIMQEWRKAHPEVPGDPEEWARVRAITSRYGDMLEAAESFEGQGRAAEAKVLRQQAHALWDSYREVLDKYYPPTEGAAYAPGGAWAPRRGRGRGRGEREREYRSWEEVADVVGDDLAKLIGYYFNTPEEKRKAYARKHPKLLKWLKSISAQALGYIENLYKGWYYSQRVGGYERYVAWRG